MSEPIELKINSEYQSLKNVIVHEPGIEIDRLSPDNRNRLLFEDIPYLKKMKVEHKEFVHLLQEKGVNVLKLKDLLLETLKNQEVVKKLIPAICNSSMVDGLSNMILDNFSNIEISNLLLAGLTASELFDKTGIRFDSIDDGNETFILDPCPNAYFTRDPAAIIGSSVVSCNMHFGPRVRESMILREIFLNHPLFAKSNVIFGMNHEEDRPYCIEGGDMIVVNDKAVAIGCSQRTRSESISLLSRKLFENGLTQRVYEINIPDERAYMHLDTVFTIVDDGVVVAYPHVMEMIQEIFRYEPMYIHGNSVVAKRIKENRTFNMILEDEFGKLDVIKTGNNNLRYASREQLADVTNVFAIAPGEVITYERNLHTNKALQAMGIKIHEISGSELVRGLGGPRCMTMPLTRIS